MNTFTFNNSVMSLIEVKQGTNQEFVTAKVTDYRSVVQPDGSEKPVFNCSRFITIFEPTLVEWVKENLSTEKEHRYLVDIAGYFTSTASKKLNAEGKPEKWYDNQVVTSLELA